MAERKGTDLPREIGGREILLITSGWTSPLADTRNWIRRLTDDRYERIFADTLNLSNLLHVGTLVTSSGFGDGEPREFIPCGTTMRIEPFPGVLAGSWIEKYDYARHLSFAVGCNSKKCDMVLGINNSIQLADLQNILFHLMLKQMIPDLKTCNFLDCSFWSHEYWKRFSDRPGNLDEIIKLGLVAVMPDIFWGQLNKAGEKPKSGIQRLDLGFMMTAGMMTQDSCDGFDNWLRFLVNKKFNQLKEIMEADKSLLLGPKSIK